LSERFGASNVFRDARSINEGEHFPARISQAIAHSDTALILIGPTWLATTDPGGSRIRLDDPEDWVRLEIEAVMQRRITTIPVLVGGAVLPSSRLLPPTIQKVAEFQAAELRDETFPQDARRLMDRMEHAVSPIRQYMGPEKARREQKFAGIAKLFTARLEEQGQTIRAVSWRHADSFRPQLDAIVDTLAPDEEVVDLALSTVQATGAHKAATTAMDTAKDTALAMLHSALLGVLAVTPRRFVFSPRIRPNDVVSLSFDTVVRVRRDFPFWGIVATMPDGSFTFSSIKPAKRVKEILNYVADRVG
jgi:hypothetical protein